MENLFFITQHFLTCFFSGCLVNFYIIIFYFMLKNAEILPSFIHTSLFIESNAIFVFIILAVIIGMIIEGIYQMLAEKYFTIVNKGNIFEKDKKNRDKYTSFSAFILYKVIGIATIYEACGYYEKNNEKNPLETFINDSKEIKFTDKYKTYNALSICSKIIENFDHTTNIYKFRDRSFILQLVRMSFFCIMLNTVLPGIYFLIQACNKSDNSFLLFGTFILISFLVSIFFIIILAPCSYNFGKRYIRDVGHAYEALKFKILNIDYNKSIINCIQN